MDDLIVIGSKLCSTEHLAMSNEIDSVVSFACVDGDLHIASNVEFFAIGVDSLVVHVDEGLLLKHYVQFVLGCEHANWVANMYLIMMF